MHDSLLLKEEYASCEYFAMKEPGSLGLSSGCCCTHKRQTWVQHNTSDRVNPLSKHPSVPHSPSLKILEPICH